MPPALDEQIRVIEFTQLPVVPAAQLVMNAWQRSRYGGRLFHTL
jgi:hypothetical protein